MPAMLVKPKMPEISLVNAWEMDKRDMADKWHWEAWRRGPYG
jgi:hypothetical protein